MPRALISVSDKRGAVEFAAGLLQLGWEIVSTGGTAHTLEKAGLAVTPVEKITGIHADATFSNSGQSLAEQLATFR